MAADIISKEIVALVLDFDDTLLPDSTSLLLKSRGVDPVRFWQQQAAALIQEGYDPPAAWLNLLLKDVGEGRPMGRLTNQDLRAFGSTLDGSFYPGIPAFFDDAREIASRYPNIEIEFYIVSGGLYEVARGNPVIQKYFKAVYGCHLAGDTPDGVLRHIKRSVTFTEKTRYIFEIHKGLNPRETWSNPILVNKYVSRGERRIPLKNMIYVGDGMTDIPCFSLLKNNGGLAFGVFDPQREKKAKEALEEFLQPDRVVSMHAPNYTKDSELGAILRAAVANRCSEIELGRVQPRRV